MRLTQVGGAVARKLKGEMQTSFTETAVDYTVGLQVTDPFLGYVYENEEYFADPQQVPFETKYFPDELDSGKWKKQKKWATKRSVEQVKEQVNNLHTKRESIEWKTGLRVTDELQLYVRDGAEYLPSSKAVPFTTGATFNADNWVQSGIISSESKIISTGSTDGRTLSDRFADVLDVKDAGVDDAQDKCGWKDSAALVAAKALNEDNRTVNERNFGNRTVKVWQKAEGIKDAAVAMSFSLAGEDEPSTQVSNYNSIAHMSQYDNRDAVGLFGQTISQPANCTTALTVFTLTSVTSNDFVGKDIKVGMTVEVFRPVRYVSIVESFINNVITVSAWYEVGKTNVTGNPTDGDTLFVNRFTKVWGQNTNVLIPTGSGANSGTGFELGMACEKVGSGSLSKGYDLITLWGGGASGNRLLCAWRLY